MVDVWSPQYDTSSHMYSVSDVAQKMPVIPCKGNGKVFNGVCKSCTWNRVYNPVTDTCDLTNVSLLPKVSKICPLPTINAGDQCRYPCPPDLHYSESRNECVHDHRESVMPNISPLRCPITHPYLRSQTMTCHDRPMLIDIDNIPIGKSFVPYEAESSLLV